MAHGVIIGAGVITEAQVDLVGAVVVAGDASSSYKACTPAGVAAADFAANAYAG